MSFLSREREPTVIQVVEPRPRLPGWLFVGMVGVLGALLAGGFGVWAALRNAPTVPAFRSSQIEVTPSPQLLVAVQDLARVETTELHVEKVVDLSDHQKVLFGLVDTKDAMLLVASGRATIGIDLGKLKAGDVTFDESTRTAHMRLPGPEVLSTALDEDKTYVYTRETDTFAKRNEALEGRARKEALAAIDAAARDPEIMKRSRDQAERQMRALATQLGAKTVDVTWQ